MRGLQNSKLQPWSKSGLWDLTFPLSRIITFPTIVVTITSLDVPPTIFSTFFSFTIVISHGSLWMFILNMCVYKWLIEILVAQCLDDHTECWPFANKYWQIASGCWQFANEYWQIASGCWQFANDYWHIASGCWQIASRCWQTANRVRFRPAHALYGPTLFVQGLSSLDCEWRHRLRILALTLE